MPVSNVQQRPSADPALGRDELNLIDFPIATLQHQQPVGKDGKRPDELVCVIESYDADLNRIVPRKLIRRTSSRHGFPTPLEDEVLIALLSLTGIKNNFTAPRVEFRNAELLNLMDWPNNGTSSQRLSVALDRLTGLKLKYENSWTTEDGEFRKDFTTGLLESYRFTQRTRGRRLTNAEQSWVQWSSEVFADVQRGNVKMLDTGEFYSLKLPVSRRMYRFLDRHLGGKPHFDMELTAFAAHLGLTQIEHTGKIKERLKPAIRELEGLGQFIQPCSTDERFHKLAPGRWRIQFDEPRPSSGSSPNSPAKSQETHVPATEAAVSLVVEFYRGWSSIENHRPSRKEVQQAGEIIERYGEQNSCQLLPQVLKLMRRAFPEARAFGATLLYWPEAERKRQKSTRHSRAENCAAAEQESQDTKTSELSRQRQKLLDQWNNLPAVDQNSIRTTVHSQACQTVKRFLDEGRFDDSLVMLACLDELASRGVTRGDGDS